MTRVDCRQLAPRITDLAGNHARSVRAITDAVSAGADVVVLPELATSGYVFASKDEARSAAITTENPILQDWQKAAGHAIVVGGFCERAGNALYNSAAVLDRSGLLAVYRKTHLWGSEKAVFTPGHEPPPVVPTRAGRIGVLICYDLEFPEMTRVLALRGAELIVAPVNWPLVDRPRGEHPPEVVIAMAAARTNRVPIACCDRTGTERGQEWTEGSCVIDESGWVRASAGNAASASIDLDLTRARTKRIGEHNDVFADRRPEFYRTVADETRPAQP